MVGGFRDYSPWYYWQTLYENLDTRLRLYYTATADKTNKNPIPNKFEAGTIVCSCCDNLNYYVGNTVVSVDESNSLCQVCLKVDPAGRNLYRRELLEAAHHRRLDERARLPRNINVFDTATIIAEDLATGITRHHP